MARPACIESDKVSDPSTFGLMSMLIIVVSSSEQLVVRWLCSVMLRNTQQNVDLHIRAQKCASLPSRYFCSILETSMGQVDLALSMDLSTYADAAITSTC